MDSAFFRSLASNFSSRQKKGRFSDSDEEYEEYCEKENQRELRDLFDSDASDQSEEPIPEPAFRRRKSENRFQYEEDEDYADSEYSVCKYELEGTKLKVRNCTWKIDGFQGSDVVKKKNGYERSNVYVSGPCNIFQFYLVMHRQKTDDDTQYGVYACILSNIRSNAKLHFESCIEDHRNRKTILDKKESECPKKPGLRFLGYLSKNEIIEDDYYNCLYMGEGYLTLSFKIDVEYKSLEEVKILEKLFDQNKVKDVVIVVKGQNFPANKNILVKESETFAKMFEGNKSNSLEIKDINPEVMKSLLTYLHTRKIPNLFTYADELLAAAQKFKLKDLKAMCKNIQE